MTRFAVLIALLLLPLACFAGEEKKRDRIMMDIPKFLEHQRALRADLESERHAHIDASARQRAYNAQDTLFMLLDGIESIDELSPDGKIQVYNAQNIVAAVLEDSELSREVCKKETHVGTHMVVLVCMTVAEHRAIEEAHHEMLMKTRNCRPAVPRASGTMPSVDACNQG